MLEIVSNSLSFCLASFYLENNQEYNPWKVCPDESAFDIPQRRMLQLIGSQGFGLLHPEFLD